MNKLIVLFTLLFAPGCSLLVHTGGAHLKECHIVFSKCPTDDQLDEFQSAFQEVKKDFDPMVQLDVIWYPTDYQIYEINDPNSGNVGSVVGQTDNDYYIEVTSFTVMSHELMHVYFGRTTGDEDYNHELPGGPWTDQSNEEIRTIRDIAMQEFPDLLEFEGGLLTRN